MTTAEKLPGQERVACEVCSKEVPKSEASVSETMDHVAYFCGPGCYRKWFAARTPAPEGPEPEIQLGHGRSKARDERLKHAVRQHPQRDEPRVDSVEDNERK